MRCVALTAMTLLPIKADQIFLDPKAAVTLTNASENSQPFFSDLQLAGKYAYLSWVDPQTNRLGGLLILDVTKPASPIQVGAYSGDITPTSIRLAGSHAFLVGANHIDQAGSMEIVNIDDPTKPFQLARVPTLAAPLCVRVTNHLAFISEKLQPTPTNISGLFEIFDIHDAQNPVKLSTFNIFAPCTAFEVLGNYLYLADGLTDLAVFDISNPTAPIQVGFYNTDEWNNYGGFEHGGAALQIFSDAGLIYSAGQDGTHILDVTIPSAPVRIGGFNVFPSDSTYQVSAELIVTFFYSSLRNDFFLVAYDVSTPAAPTRVLWMEAPTYPSAIQIREPYLFFAGPSLSIFEIKREPAFRAFTRTNEQLFLKWNAPPGFKLQAAPSPTAPVWTDVTELPWDTQIQLPITETNKFFRLYKP
jgi:hypothetical protein